MDNLKILSLAMALSSISAAGAKELHWTCEDGSQPSVKITNPEQEHFQPSDLAYHTSADKGIITGRTPQKNSEEDDPGPVSEKVTLCQDHFPVSGLNPNIGHTFPPEAQCFNSNEENNLVAVAVMLKLIKRIRRWCH
ncbi:hypothetical protein [Pantoea sp. GD03673]|uniref:hypothetical protein n=1 Tax=Pantoea sp. GD03673 TaxID=2975364 RepID=UPI0024486425|nr:hypothetical protein [Pantoea sp. GD03673]MDH2066117.1 hypothetical protein [Pantoea sp. GD03673]